MVKRLFHFEAEQQTVDDRIDAKVPVAAEAAGRDVIGGHDSGDDTGRAVHAALEDLVVAARAKCFHHSSVPPVDPHMVEQLMCHEARQLFR